VETEAAGYFLLRLEDFCMAMKSAESAAPFHSSVCAPLPPCRDEPWPKVPHVLEAASADVVQIKINELTKKGLCKPA